MDNGIESPTLAKELGMSRLGPANKCRPQTSVRSALLARLSFFSFSVLYHGACRKSNGNTHVDGWMDYLGRAKNMKYGFPCLLHKIWRRKYTK